MAHKNDTNGNGSTINFPSINVATDDIVTVGLASPSAISTITITDGQGNSYTAHTGNGLQAGAVKVWLFRVRIPAANASLAIVSTPNTVGACSGVIAINDGILTSSELDGTGSAGEGGLLTSHSNGSVTPTGGNTDIIAFSAEDLASGTAVHTPGSGWMKTNENNDANSYATSFMQRRVAQPVGAYANAWTTTAASQNASLVWALKNTGWAVGVMPPLLYVKRTYFVDERVIQI